MILFQGPARDSESGNIIYKHKALDSDGIVSPGMVYYYCGTAKYDKYMPNRKTFSRCCKTLQFFRSVNLCSGILSQETPLITKILYCLVLESLFILSRSIRVLSLARLRLRSHDAGTF